LVEAQFRWEIGDEVRERVATGSETPRRLLIKGKAYFDSHAAYILGDADSGDTMGGLYREDQLEPYDPTPIPFALERD
jgi:hypothetical protein